MSIYQRVLSGMILHVLGRETDLGSQPEVRALSPMSRPGAWMIWMFLFAHSMNFIIFSLKLNMYEDLEGLFDIQDTSRLF